MHISAGGIISQSGSLGVLVSEDNRVVRCESGRVRCVTQVDSVRSVTRGGSGV